MQAFITASSKIVTESKISTGFKIIIDSYIIKKIGGGGSISAVNKYNLADKFSYICICRGAVMRFLS